MEKVQDFSFSMVISRLGEGSVVRMGDGKVVKEAMHVGNVASNIGMVDTDVADGG